MSDRSSAEPRTPQHVAIIMDGNGRWARARGLPRSAGHRQGAEAVRRSVEAAVAAGVPYLTLFGFSSENWKRPEEEVQTLMGLLKLYLRKEIAELHRNGVRLRVIGERERLASDIAALIDRAEALTADNTRLTLTVALSYGARDEIAAAARRIAQAAAAGRLDPEAVTADTLGDHLMTAGIPDPDLIIRTSGERRVSNFLLWQAAYAEFLFIDTLWPDFDEATFRAALDDYGRRERRFGALATAP